MRDVAIVGVSMLKFGRYPEKSVPELGSQATLLALKDGGVTMKDIEIMVCGNLYQSNATVGQRILKEIGQTGIPVINVSNACATGSTAFREAYFSVASGAAAWITARISCSFCWMCSGNCAMYSSIVAGCPCFASTPYLPQTFELCLRKQGFRHCCLV